MKPKKFSNLPISECFGLVAAGSFSQIRFIPFVACCCCLLAYARGYSLKDELFEINFFKQTFFLTFNLLMLLLLPKKGIQLFSASKFIY